MEEDPEATEEEKALEFVGKSPLWRITVLFAGSFMNFVLAFLLFILVFGFAGRPEQPLVTLTVASHVFKDTPASAAGILPGDKFLAVDNITVTSWNHFRSLIEERTDKQTKLLITRDGENQEVTITPERMGDPLSTVGKIGVVPAQPAIVGDIPPGSPALSPRWFQKLI
jgi:regulator of sigma E protease